MSQEKIDKRKAEKANRKKMLAKKKQKRILNILIAALVTICFIGLVTLAVCQLSGKFEKETTTQAISYSAEELSSLSEALGLETGTTAEGDTTAEGETPAEAASEETTVENSEE